MVQVPVKNAGILYCLIFISIFFAVHIAFAQNISFAPIKNNNFIGFGNPDDCANVETTAYKDFVIYSLNPNNPGIYVAWGGPVDINQFGQITSDQAYTDTTLVSNLSGWWFSGARFADLYNNGQMCIVGLSEDNNAPDFYIFKYLGNRQFGPQQLLFSGVYNPSNYYGVSLDAIVDLKGNGYPDIICDEDYWVGSSIAKEVVIYWNNNGSFSSSDYSILPNCIYLGAADFNGTGLKSIIVSGYESNPNNFEIYTQTSPGVISSSPTIYTGSNYGYSYDINGIPIGNFTSGKEPSFIAVENNKVDTGILSNEVVLFSNNMNNSNPTSGFTQIPVWIDNNTQDILCALPQSADINGDGNPDFVLASDNGRYDSASNWLQAWYCAPLGNAITFETQIIKQWNFIGGYDYVGNLNNSGFADVIDYGTIYYTYKDSPMPIPVFPSGGGGGGAVSPLVFLIFGFITFVKIKYRHKRRNYAK
ncbi:MAG: hypothetical protein M1135_02940 [Candidatus Omnitrophica bacterium]|nr:hypothetical protein [Candidatus Omnitrophota bacterium]